MSRRAGWFAALAAAAILAYQLFIPPIVGLANNGDFEKIMGIVGLRYPETATSDDKYYRWATTRLMLAPPWWNSGYRTSETVLVRASMVPAKLAGTDVFDMRWLGGLHAALFLLFFASIVRSFARKESAAAVPVTLAGLFFFTDVGYAAPMNSLYGQEASFLGLFGIFAVVAAAWRKGRFTPLLAVAYYGASAFFVVSKPQETVQAIVLAAFGIWMTACEGGRVRVLGLAGAAGLVVFGIWCWAGVPPKMKEAGLRKVVFGEILAHSPDARRDLSDMGLDPDWAGRSPEFIFADPAAERTFTARFGRSRLVLFLAAHPRRAAGLLLPTARAALVLRPPMFGDLPSCSGYRERQRSSAFGAWSSIRAAVAPVGPALLILLFGGSAVAAGRALRRRGGNGVGAKSALLLVALGTIALGVCALGSSGVERERHLFVFDAITDALIALAIGAGAARLMTIGKTRSDGV